MGNLGSECPVSGIVPESEGCRAAGTQLGRKYNGFVYNLESPAGCYYFSTNNYVYLNFASPSDTQNISSSAGGVCKAGICDIICTYCKHTK